MLRQLLIPYLSLIRSDAVMLAQNRGYFKRWYPRMKQKHWNPKYKYLRAKKVIKLDYVSAIKFDDPDLTEEEKRTLMKERGLVPPRPWNEDEMISLSCTNEVMEAYKPKEGDGRLSLLSKERSKDLVKEGWKNMRAKRKIKEYEGSFDDYQFASEAQEIYKEIHEKLALKDKDRLHALVTEKCFPEMMENTELKTIRWNFLKSIEPPKVVQLRVQSLITEENYYAQITVRHHTQQTLAIYDRFGRLEYGSEVVPKDVLEYAVYEKPLVMQYGNWRLHSKIIPDSAPKPSPVARTYRKADPPPTPPPEEESQLIEDKEEMPPQKEEVTGSRLAPA